MITITFQGGSARFYGWMFYLSSLSLSFISGVEGLEAAIEADEELEAAEPLHLFDYYINTCPLQQTRTIRTEEAVLISLCTLQDKLVPKGMQ